MSLRNLVNDVLQVLGIAGDGSAAKWFRRVSGAADIIEGDALSQATWYIDLANGNDLNSGVDPANALRTYDEFERRAGAHVGTLRQQTTVNFIGPTYTEPLHVTATVMASPLEGANLILAGTRQGTTANEVLTATTDQDPLMDTRQTVTAPSLGPSSVGRMITIVASAVPANVGAIAWVAADLGGGQVQTQQFKGANGAAVDPQVGDTISVSGATLFTGPIVLESGSTVFFIDVEVAATVAPGGFINQQALPVQFLKSRWAGDGTSTFVNVFAPGSETIFNGCLVAAPVTITFASIVHFSGVLCQGPGTWTPLNGGMLFIDGATHSLFQSVAAIARHIRALEGGEVILSTGSGAGFFNLSGVANGGAIVLGVQGGADLRGLAWGNVTGWGFQIDATGMMTYVLGAATTPNITNTLGDVNVGGGGAVAFGAQSINATNNATYAQRLAAGL